MADRFFYILRKTRKEARGWDIFTGKYIEDEQDSEYYVAWYQKSDVDGFIIASRDTLPDLKDYLDKHYSEYRYMIIDNKELNING